DQAPTVLVAPEEVEAADTVRIGPMGVERPKKKLRFRLLPYGPLLLIGLALFVGGVAWQLTRRDTMGLGVALVGALDVAISTYYLLRQLGGDDPADAG
ncbi:MAG TPA: hypothetical protein VFN88_12795, partial [Caulobacteraceae bacterium]|nr:hypothetical protein [Caulobacteraceae bacterium]